MVRAYRYPVNGRGWVQPACLEKAESAKPAAIVSSPNRAIKGSGLAVAGRGSTAATVVGPEGATAAGAATAAGGASTTCASSTGSPVGATASIGAVFRASTGAVSNSIEVASTGVLASLANSMARGFA